MTQFGIAAVFLVIVIPQLVSISTQSELLSGFGRRRR